MSRLNDASVELAHRIIARYPRKRSATIPLLHVAQQQDGHVTDEAIEHIAELVEATPAEVRGTCTFYEMFKLHPVGTYMVNICTNVSCQIMGAEEILHHVEERLGIRSGSTTADGLFTVEDVECIAACTEAPCLQVNYRYFTNVTTADVDRILDDLTAGRLADDVPPHGTLARVVQDPGDNWAGRTDAVPPVPEQLA